MEGVMFQKGLHFRRDRSVRYSAFVLVFLFLYSGVGCMSYEIDITEYDPARAYNGYTYFSVRSVQLIMAVDMNGNEVWNPVGTGVVNVGNAHGFRFVEEESLIVYVNDHRPLAMRTEDYEIVFEGPYDKAHHSIVMTPDRTLMYLSMERVDGVPGEYWLPEGCLIEDVIKEIDMDTEEIVWEWHLIDHLDPTEHHASEKSFLSELYECSEWAHGNTVKFIPNYSYQGINYDAVLYNSLFLETFWMIDYASGDVLWSCGQHGTFGRKEPPEEPFFSGAHDVDIVTNDTFIMYDNGNYRAVPQSWALKMSVDPLAGEGEEIWSWRYPYMYDWWGGDADELPNGNVLIANTTAGRIIEVTPGGEIVWEMRIHLYGFTSPHTVYQLQRVPY